MTESYFLPEGWSDFAAERDRIGLDRLGQLLAMGKRTAGYLDRGEIVELPAATWRSHGARECLESGEFISRTTTLQGSRLVERWVLYLIPEPVKRSIPMPVAANDSRPLRNPTAADATELASEAKRRANAGDPMTSAEVNQWASDHRLSRQWARDQHRAFPPEWRRERGQVRSRKRDAEE